MEKNQKTVDYHKKFRGAVEKISLFEGLMLIF